MTLAAHVRTLGRGPGRSRNLTREEACDAMAEILTGQAAPEAVGALLMLMRFRGESPAELAGFVDALRPTLPVWDGAPPAIDWPSYAAGRSRGLPWFLLSARLLGEAGLPVLLHGARASDDADDAFELMLQAAGIPLARHGDADARRYLTEHGVAFLPLRALSPKAVGLLRLREVLGLRSAINTVLRIMNPAGAACSVQGVFHPPYRALQRDACALLGQPASLVLKGGGGEFERHPGKEIALFGQRAGAGWDDRTPALLDEASLRLKDGPADDTNPAALSALWSGDLHDPFAEAIVTGTTAVALLAKGRAGSVAEADAQARALWTARNTAHAASPVC
ncbi:MAG: glycosyl transferase family protein [Rhodobacteraceae bacterium]|nr:glycosyl transferase family protein [Paracoccaceae bacterium]